MIGIVFHVNRFHEIVFHGYWEHDWKGSGLYPEKTLPDNMKHGTSKRLS